jgi:hypothetical protein
VILVATIGICEKQTQLAGMSISIAKQTAKLRVEVHRARRRRVSFPTQESGSIGTSRAIRLLPRQLTNLRTRRAEAVVLVHHCLARWSALLSVLPGCQHVFRGIAMSRKTLVIAAIAVLLLVAGALWLRHQLMIDGCLDRGGRWNHDTGLCEGARE